MRKKKVTMLDIATAVGVSQPTVSVILNGSDSIKVSQETRDKVLAKADELGYQRKANVRHASHHRRIALLVNSINMHDPFINAITAAKVRAWELDILLVVYDYEDDELLKQAMLKEIQEGQYSALIYAANTPKQIDDEPKLGIPLLYLNCNNPESSVQSPAILTSDFIGGYRATEHLLQRGYKRIAMIGGERWSDSSIQRISGYRQALLNTDTPINDDWIVEGNWSVKQSFLETKKLLSQSPCPNAIFCASDLMALGVYQAVAEMGLRIPHDVAVMGYDNQLLASELTPSLSSIDLPYDEMGRMAVELAVGDHQTELQLIKVEGDLYPREST
ncbi:LacI family DNA-binding transcriptional regulator [Vibrio sp.]|uniref:LacI family DNA-binding transcriptional regulator n=1 Tax=Vibrio sp. TaxID=678 RepID=UPI003D14FB48